MKFGKDLASIAAVIDTRKVMCATMVPFLCEKLSAAVPGPRRIERLPDERQ
jgi:hypothetical protein